MEASTRDGRDFHIRIRRPFGGVGRRHTDCAYRPGPRILAAADNWSVVGRSRELERGVKTVEPQYPDIDGAEKSVAPHGDPGIISCSKEDTVCGGPNSRGVGSAWRVGDVGGNGKESPDRPYSQEDLDDKTTGFDCHHPRQISRWAEFTFDPSKIKKDVLKARILENGFISSASLSLQSRTSSAERERNPVGPQTHHQSGMLRLYPRPTTWITNYD
ncbi:hypothetical protein B0H13DRAFT_1879341 [Mycena leptocephala]|nr:hypothetical protein B0H13DRAFT_1879341 [Mycena leptocephala]